MKKGKLSPSVPIDPKQPWVGLGYVISILMVQVGVQMSELPIKEIKAIQQRAREIAADKKGKFIICEGARLMVLTCESLLKELREREEGGHAE
ncbi:MAG TPA: hypothetical protein VGN61_04155 [Verrucomicrobiae bacterium]|jgi:hypothetical protein